MKIVKSNSLIVSSGGKILSQSNGYVMPITQTSDLFGVSLRGTGTILVDWGDGLSNSYVLNTVSDTYVSHSYSGFSLGRRKYINLYNSDFITKFDSQYVDGRTNFGFDLSFLPNCTYFICQGSNTISGSLSGMPNCTYFICQGSNTISGSLSGMPNCTFFNCIGSNTVGGSLSGMPNCTFFSLRGSNTVGGSLSGISSQVAYILLGGDNTVTYSTFNTQYLCYFDMQKTVLTNAQENEILQGVYNNRDVSKPRTDRYINVSGAVGSSSLDTTGQNLKTLLQAYITPPGAVAWTILNR